MNKKVSKNYSVAYGSTKEVLNELGIDGLPGSDERYCLAFNSPDEGLEWGYETCKTKKELLELLSIYS